MWAIPLFDPEINDAVQQKHRRLFRWMFFLLLGVYVIKLQSENHQRQTGR
jgi:hypothetical protein